MQCGDGVCNCGETSVTCCADCVQICGDGYCGCDETDVTCTIDCVFLTRTPIPSTNRATSSSRIEISNLIGPSIDPEVSIKLFPSVAPPPIPSPTLFTSNTNWNNLNNNNNNANNATNNFQNCTNCTEQVEPITIDVTAQNLFNNGNNLSNLNWNSDTISIQVMTTNGISVGTVAIPMGDLPLGSSIQIFQPDPSTYTTDSKIRSDVLTIKIFDSSGNPITNFSESIEICFNSTAIDNEEDYCLSYESKENGNWECEDSCLKKSSDHFCGKTNHLTNFALLFDIGNSGDCGESDFTIAWIALAFCIFAILLCIFATVIYEIRMRIQRYQRDMKMNRMIDKVQKVTSRENTH